MNAASPIPRRTSRRLAALLLVLIAASLLWGCGRYGFTAKEGQSALPEDVRTIYVRSVENPTMHTWLPARLVSNFRDEITQRHMLEWSTRDAADALVDLEIVRFAISSSLLTKEETTLQYSASVTLNARIYGRADNDLLWQRSSSWSETFLAANDQVARERALDLAVQRLVDQLTDAY